MSTDKDLRQKFEAMPPEKRANALRGIAALLEDDGGDADEAAFIDQNLREIISDFRKAADYYDTQATDPALGGDA